jgi:hypothetical protein
MGGARRPPTAIDFISATIVDGGKRSFLCEEVQLCRCLQPTKTFFLISSYVGFVPVSDVLAIFVTDRQCEFW